MGLHLAHNYDDDMKGVLNMLIPLEDDGSNAECNFFLKNAAEGIGDWQRGGNLVQETTPVGQPTVRIPASLGGNTPLGGIGSRQAAIGGIENGSGVAK